MFLLPEPAPVPGSQAAPSREAAGRPESLTVCSCGLLEVAGFALRATREKVPWRLDWCSGGFEWKKKISKATKSCANGTRARVVVPRKA